MNIFIDKPVYSKLPDEWLSRVQFGKFAAVISKRLGSASLDEITRQAKSKFGESVIVEVSKPGWVRVVYERQDVPFIHLEPEETWRLLRSPGVCMYYKRGEFWIGVKE